MENRIRVLWLIKGLGLGGAEKIVAMSAPALQSAGCDVEVAYVLPDANHWLLPLTESGLQVYCLGGRGLSRHLWPVRLGQLLASRRYDVVHSHSPLLGAAARSLAMSRRLVMVHTEHNVWQSYRPLTRFANTVTTGRNRLVFAVSEGVAGSMQSPRWVPWMRLPPFEVLYHGIDETEIQAHAGARSAARMQLGLAHETPLLVTVGNLSAKKDHRLLLTAFAEVGHRRSDAILVIIGGGPLAEELRRYADELGLDDRVRFLGQRSDVPSLLPAFDVFVLSSRHEGLPLAMLEAMASGLPVVVTEVGGVPEVVSHDENGLMVPPGDPIALAAAIESVLDDRSRSARLAAMGRVTASEFSIRASVERTKAAYSGLLRGV